VSWWRRDDARAVDGRWLVVDVESSGLDAARDRLLAIAAVAVRPLGARLPIVLGDSFEIVLRQPDVAPDKTNILIHGIGVGAQRDGVEPSQALEDFARFADGAPLIAFHAAFDRTLIERARRAAGLPRLASRWLDLADLAPVVRPVPGLHALDDWLAACGIPVAVRHQAAADAFATAELLQMLWPQVRAQGGSGDFRTLVRLAAARRWTG
jgi:DNA polymerase III subunit epsilon